MVDEDGGQADEPGRRRLIPQLTAKYRASHHIPHPAAELAQASRSTRRPLPDARRRETAAKTSNASEIPLP
nr:unnamed protein product [Digitaria exilis]